MDEKKIIVVLLTVFYALLSGCTSLYSNKQLDTVFTALGLESEETVQGVVVFIPEVYFDFDSANLNYQALAKIGKIASIVNQSEVKQRNIIVEGHTDSIGSTKFNLGLSIRRAEAVKQRLVDGQVSEKRILVMGYGEKYPVAENKNPNGTDNSKGRAKNRRVEITVKNQETEQ
jgi:outer membrane protein OmpA-like peptidoglycan-associated protein